MSSTWSATERFEITDAAGAPQFEARGHFGSLITLLDSSGHDVAEIRKHAFSDTHEVYLGGQRAARVRHAGLAADHYDIDCGYGQLTARGHVDDGSYTLNRGGTPVASMTRRSSLREKFAIDIASGQNDVLLLALMLAIEAIHAERREQQHRGAPRV